MSVEEEKEELSRVVKTSQFAVNDVKKNVNELRASLEETKRSVNGLRGSVEETKKGASDDALAEGVAALKVSVERGGDAQKLPRYMSTEIALFRALGKSGGKGFSVGVWRTSEA